MFGFRIYADTSLMEAYEGYWVKARQANVFLRFNHESQVADLSAPQRIWLAVKEKTLEWSRNVMPQTRAAIADSDTPPMPMGAFANDVDPVFEGCFIESAGRD